MSPSRTPAGLPRRLGALLYDTLLLLAVWLLATALLLPLHGGEAFRPDHWGYNVYLLAVAYGFFTWFWTHGGQTLGMRAWQLRLRALDGGSVGFGQATRRFLGAILSLLPFGLGYLWALVDREGRCWHDCFSGTRLDREQSF